MTPVSIRYNNPGALNIAPWVQKLPGYVGESETTPGNHTARFDTPEAGVAAWHILMQKYQSSGARTLGQIVDRYGGGQDYSSYVTQVEQWSGISRSTVIDLENDAQTLTFAKAMFHYEAGVVTPLSDKQIMDGFKLARGEVIHVTTTPTVPISTEASGFVVSLIRAIGQAFKVFNRS